MFLHEFGKRILARPLEYGAKLGIASEFRQKIIAVGLPQCFDERIAPLLANLAIFVAPSSVDTWF